MGHQTCGGWSEEIRGEHINLQDLLVWLLQHLSSGHNRQVRHGQCRRLQSQGAARSDALLSLTEQIFSIVLERGFTHSALRQGKGQRLGGCPLPALGDVSGAEPGPKDLSGLNYAPVVDLFASQTTEQLSAWGRFTSSHLQRR